MDYRPSAHRPQGSEAEEVPERQRCCNKEGQRDEKDKITKRHKILQKKTERHNVITDKVTKNLLQNTQRETKQR